MAAHADLDAMARRVVDANCYMTLGTVDPDGQPRLSPVYYACAGYSSFYWASQPAARHSQNLRERPNVRIVIFDSTAPVGRGEAVYISGTGAEIPSERFADDLWSDSLRAIPRASVFAPDELRDSGLRLYAAETVSCEVHVPGGHPVYGTGVDTRLPADPTRSPRPRPV
jgi:hypothetical protein